jgi:aryl-alcohol dehydrogenase-like predicted oxidoreductase
VRVGRSDLEVLPVMLGGNVFGWTLDRSASMEVLDAFHDGGGNFLDTADAYSHWAPGNLGGDSESMLGEWLASRRPEDIVVATKVGGHPAQADLSPDTVRAAVRGSLRRLGLETIDIYFAHFDDADTPLEETVGVFQELVDQGLVRYPALSNYSPSRVREWLDVADQMGAVPPVAIEPHYSLMAREAEAELLPLAEEAQLSVLPYFALAEGFLTGKYRAATDMGGTVRSTRIAELATPANFALLDAVERVAKAHGVSMATVALAWCRAQPSVVAPVVSATRPSHVNDMLASAVLDLAPEDVSMLLSASQHLVGQGADHR